MFVHRPSIIDEGLRTLQQTQIDQQWLKTWLEKKPKPMTLSDYRQRLISHAHLLEQFHQALEQMDHPRLLQLKTLIEQSNEQIYDEKLIKHIQQEVRRRKSKRARLRRQKSKEQQPSMEMEIPSKTWREKIDDVQLILKEIEQVKEKGMEQRTKDQLMEMEQLCQMKIEEYQNEMKNNPTDDLFHYLFNNDGYSFYQSTTTDSDIFLRAHQSLSNLIDIRRGWDRFLIDRHRSCSTDHLPMQWHEVHSPSDSHWSQFIIERKC